MLYGLLHVNNALVADKVAGTAVQVVELLRAFCTDSHTGLSGLFYFLKI